MVPLNIYKFRWLRRSVRSCKTPGYLGKFQNITRSRVRFAKISTYSPMLCFRKVLILPNFLLF